MNCRNRGYVGIVFLVKILKVGQVLEVVGVYFTALNHIIGLNVIGKFLNVKLYIFLGKNFLCNR